MSWPLLHKDSFAMINAERELVGVATLADELDVASISCKGCHPFMQEQSALF
jgi:hypothetical protein